MGGGAGAGGASTGVGGAASPSTSAGTGSTTSPNSAQSTDMSAAIAQARDSGITSGKGGVTTDGMNAKGPLGGTEMNTDGGYKNTEAQQTATQRDGRSAVEQVGNAGQTIKEAGVTTDNLPSQKESQGQINNMVGKPEPPQPPNSPQTNAAYKQAASTSAPDPTVNQNQPTP